MVHALMSGVAFSAFEAGCFHVDPNCTEAEAQGAFEATGGVDGYMDKSSFRLWHSHLGTIPEAKAPTKLIKVIDCIGKL